VRDLTDINIVEGVATHQTGLQLLVDERLEGTVQLNAVEDLLGSVTSIIRLTKPSVFPSDRQNFIGFSRSKHDRHKLTKGSVSLEDMSATKAVNHCTILTADTESTSL
jgi:hypothetical protein